MIRDHDRSGWFGASDTSMVVGNWSTKSFLSWWMEKLGVQRSTLKTEAMLVGTAYEHRILDAIGVPIRDRQIRCRSLRLRVNLDGEDRNTVYEVKTHRSESFRLTKGYWRQCQVEMLATRKNCVVVAYRLNEEDYRNFFNPIDRDRLTFHEVAYDRAFLEEIYLPRLRYLSSCLKAGTLPDANQFH